MSEFSNLSETDASNTSFSGVDISEGCNPSNVNNWMRAFAGATRRWFKSSLFRLRDSTDQTKLLAFDLSGLSAATTRTLKVPNVSGTVYTDASPLSGFRNKLINGGFTVAQRGTSFAVSGGETYWLDRWFGRRGGSVSGATITRESAGGPAGAQYYVRLRRDSGNTSTQGLAIAQAMETSASIPLQGKTVTVTFQARRGANYSAASNNFLVAIRSGTGADESPDAFGGFATGDAIAASGGATLTTAWQKFSFVGQVSSTATQIMVQFGGSAFVGTAGAADWVDIALVSLVEGDASSEADPFSPRHPQQELALCKRYYQTFGGRSASELVGFGHAIATNRAYFGVPISVEMRTTPTLTVSAASDWRAAGDTGTGLTLQSMAVGTGSNSQTVMIDATPVGSPLVIGRATRLFAGSIDARLGLDAEL